MRSRIDKKLIIVFLIALVSVVAGMGAVQSMSSNVAITLKSPANGGTLPPGNLTVSGTIAANQPIRAFVELSNQGRASELSLVPSGDHYNFSFTFQDCPEGSYIITVVVIDASDRTLGSATIRVTLSGNQTTVTPLPSGDPVPCGVQPCTPPPAPCGNPCPPPSTPPPVTIDVPPLPAPPPQVVIVHQPQPDNPPPIVVKVHGQDAAPAPIVVFDQPQAPQPQQIKIEMPPTPSAPPPVMYNAPPTPQAPPPVVTIVPPPPPPTDDTSPCNCANDGSGGSHHGGGSSGGSGGGSFPSNSFFDDP